MQYVYAINSSFFATSLLDITNVKRHSRGLQLLDIYKNLSEAPGRFKSQGSRISF